MREIKFRAWNGEMMSKPFSPTDLTATEYRSWTDNDGVSVAWPTENGSCNNWMQYTGLKDKSGNEIYEGDIIQHQNEEADKTPYAVPTLSSTTWEIIYGIGDTEWLIGDNQYSNIEILGNIHENPELLK